MLAILLRPIVRQYAIVITVNLCVISLGMGLAWPSPVLVKLRNETETVLPRPITEEQGSWIVSIGFLVATFTNFLPAILVDKIGRKYCIILACIPRIIVGLLFTFATTFWQLLLGRSLVALSDCFIMTVVPMYAAEVASKELRGRLGTILQIFSSLGILIMFCMGPFVSYMVLNVVFTCLSIAATVPTLFLSDSPYYLYSKGRTAESIKILTILRGSKLTADEEIKEYADSKTNVKVSKIQLFKDKTFLKSAGIVTFLGAGGQLIGFNAVSFYLQTILESTQTTIKNEVASVIIGFIQLFASLCTASVSDRFGRKPIFTTTLIGMSLGMIGLGTFFKISESSNHITGFMNFVPLGSLILVVFCFSAGFGSLYWMMITELFEGPARGIGVALSINTCTVFVFLTTKYFPLLTTAIGPAATYWIFGVNCVIMALFILFCVPETKGKTFAEIQVALGANEERSSSEESRKKMERGDTPL